MARNVQDAIWHFDCCALSVRLYVGLVYTRQFGWEKGPPVRLVVEANHIQITLRAHKDFSNAPGKAPKFVGVAFAQAKGMTTYFGRS